jgi:hypothetical protein
VVLIVIGSCSTIYRNAAERASDWRINVYLRNIVAEFEQSALAIARTRNAWRAAVLHSVVRLVLADQRIGETPEKKWSRCRPKAAFRRSKA